MSSHIFRGLRFHTALATILITGILLTLLIARQADVSLLLLVFLLGAAGGVTTNYLRLRDLPIAELSESSHYCLGAIQVYVSPLIAGVFAVVLYGVFVSGLLAGELFPQFRSTRSEFSGVVDLFQTVAPASQLDAAKVLVWAFIAGFAERLVPNTIDRLVSEARSEK